MNEFEQAILDLLKAGAVRVMDPETGWVSMHNNHFWVHDDGISDIFGVHIEIGDSVLRQLSELMQSSEVAPLWVI